MTYEKISQYKACKTSQFGADIDKKIQIFSKSQRGFGRSMWDIQTPSLSLCAGSRNHRGKSSDTRSQASLYGQIVKKTNSGNTTICEIYGEEHKRDSHRILGSFFAQGPGEWQKRTKIIGLSCWSTDLTDWRPARLPRLIGYWCLIRFG